MFWGQVSNVLVGEHLLLKLRLNLSRGDIKLEVTCCLPVPTWSQRVAWSLPVGAWEVEAVEGHGAVNTFCPRYGSAARSSGCRAAPPARRARPNVPCTREPWAERYVFHFLTLFDSPLNFPCSFELLFIVMSYLIWILTCRNVFFLFQT